MKIIDCNETRICESNFIKKTVYIDIDISAWHIKILSQEDVLIFNEVAELPYFKIISEQYTIRGAVGSNRVSIEFNSADRRVCDLWAVALLRRLATALTVD